MSDQFGYARKGPSDLQNIGRKPLQMNMMNLPPQRSRKPGFLGEDEDNETSQFFNVFNRPDKDMNPGVIPSQSPSQLTGFGAGNFFTPGNLTLPQRPIGSGQFRNNTATPTSMNPGFPMGLQQPQQQHSPNSNITAIGPRNILGSQSQSNQLSNLQKRSNMVNSFGGAGPLTSYSTFGFGSSRSIDSHPTIDLSDFPSLSSRNSIAPNPVQVNRTYVGMVSKPQQESAPEFNITQEEFPALPGAQNQPSQSTDSSAKTPTSTPTGFDPMGNKDANKFITDKLPGGQPKRGIQTHPDGTVTNIPSGMVIDQFGIVGLLTFIRAAESDHNLVALAPGIDLTTLGLNLNSPENLYSTFQSPWADAPCRPQDIDFHVPAEYLTNIFIREKLAPIKLNRYGEDLLFFLFYMNGGDVLQLAAAAELYNRDWRYHKEERVWMTRAPGMEPVHKTNTSERGTYYFFDAQNWRKVAKEFHLEYDKLEDRPTLPTTLHHNPNMPSLPH